MSAWNRRVPGRIGPAAGIMVLVLAGGVAHWLLADTARPDARVGELNPPAAVTDPPPASRPTTGASPVDASVTAVRAVNGAGESPANHRGNSVSTARDMDFSQFSANLAEIFGSHQAPPRDLYLTLHDPGAYLHNLRRLQHYSGDAQADQAVEQHIPLYSGTGRDARGAINEPRTDYAYLPIIDYLDFALELPDHVHARHLVVRWIDLEEEAVTRMQWVQGGDVAGRRAFISGPGGRVSEGSFRVEVFDAADESLPRLSWTPIRVGETDAGTD